MNKLKLVVCILVVFMMSGCNNSKYETGYGDGEDYSKIIQQFPDFEFNQNAGQSYMLEGSAAAETGYYYITSHAMAATQDKFLYFYDMVSQTSVPLCSNMKCEHSDSGCVAYMPEERCLGGNLWYYDQHIYMIERTEEKDSLISYDREGRNKKTVTVLSDGNANVGLKSNPQGAACVNNGYLYYALYDPEKIAEGYGDIIICRTALNGSSKAEELETLKVGNEIGGSLGFYTMEDRVYLFYIQGITKTEYTYFVYEYDEKEGSLHTLIEKSNTEFAKISRGRILDWAKKGCIDGDGNLYFVTYVGENTSNSVNISSADINNKILVLNKYNFVTGENQELYVLQGSESEKVTMNSLSLGGYDGTYLYFYESVMALPESKNRVPVETSNNIVVMNTDGSVVDKIHFTINKEFTDKFYRGRNTVVITINIIGGDERYLMVQTNQDDIKGMEQSEVWMEFKKEKEKKDLNTSYRSNVIAVLDKRQIGTGTYDWIKVK